MSKVSIMVAGLVMLAALGQARADLGGNMLSQGTYECADTAGELSGGFTFNSSKVSLTIKGEQIQLICNNQLASAELETRFFLAQNYARSVDVCTGQYKNGKVVIGTSQGMGNVVMHAFLLEGHFKIKAKTQLNCKQEPFKPSGSGW